MPSSVPSTRGSFVETLRDYFFWVLDYGITNLHGINTINRAERKITEVLCHRIYFAAAFGHQAIPFGWHIERVCRAFKHIAPISFVRDVLLECHLDRARLKPRAHAHDRG